MQSWHIVLLVAIVVGAVVTLWLAVRRRSSARPDAKSEKISFKEKIGDITLPVKEEKRVVKEIPEEEPRSEERAEERAEEKEKIASDRVVPIRKGLEKTRGGFVFRLKQLVGGKRELSADLVAQIEELFITSDIGVATTQLFLQRLQENLSGENLADQNRVWAFIKEEARRILAVQFEEPKSSPGDIYTIMVVGVNGVGKTTTIGKMAHRFQQEGKKTILAAADTFRAAAVSQLEVWGRRAGSNIVKGKEGADPSSVVFEAIEKAKSEKADVVIADTAGRLHTKIPLMEELKKIKRVMSKAQASAPHEILLVLDATTGQNGLVQARSFLEALDVTGIVLTKLDGTAKGGIILSICNEMKIPVRYIGIGEGVEDLKDFDAGEFVAALFDEIAEKEVAA